MKAFDTATSLGSLILRVGFGLYLAAHGWGKVQMILDSQFDKFPDPIGMGSKLSLFAVAGAEFGCSLLVVIGLFTRLATLPVIFTMLVAVSVVHRADPWLMSGTGGSKEPAILFLTAFGAILLLGPGRFSLDAMLFGRKPAPADDSNADPA